MGWESISVADIEVSADTGRDVMQPIPAGSYTLQLMGAEASKFQTGATNVKFAVADEGSEFRGRYVFMDIPDPDRVTWAPEVYARIVGALGTSVQPYTNPIDELNKLAQNGHSKLTGDVFIENFTRKDGTPGSKNKIRYRSLRAAA